MGKRERDDPTRESRRDKAKKRENKTEKEIAEVYIGLERDERTRRKDKSASDGREGKKGKRAQMSKEGGKRNREWEVGNG